MSIFLLLLLLSISIPIPVYLGILKYYYKEDDRITTWNYIAIVFFSLLIIISALNCRWTRSMNCIIGPLLLLVPLQFFYLVYLIQHFRKTPKYDKHDKIIARVIIVSLVLPGVLLLYE
jgi:uncharacterized membrane protein